jgi:hypothetical protein
VINVIHLVQSRGMGSAWRRPRPIAPQPPGLPHLMLIEGGAPDAARHIRPPRAEAAPPAAPSPGSG